jgi:hypothetical protein
MSELAKHYTGGCLCGALRYVAQGEPTMMGHCYCADCRKASGSGFIPFMSFKASNVSFSGPTRQFSSESARGTVAVRNFCAACSSLVFGGIVGQDESHSVYAGSLDDPTSFAPKVAIFVRNRPEWAVIPAGLTLFDALPG